MRHCGVEIEEKAANNIPSAVTVAVAESEEYKPTSPPARVSSVGMFATVNSTQQQVEDEKPDMSPHQKAINDFTRFSAYD